MRKALSVFVRTACAVGAVALAMSTSVNAQVKKYMPRSVVGRGTTSSLLTRRV
jgi:hypothetical protein